MEVLLRYFDGCPNWRATYDRVLAVLDERGLADVDVALERVESLEDADRLRFIVHRRSSSTDSMRFLRQETRSD